MFDLIQIRLFGFLGVLFQTNCLTDSVEKFCLGFFVHIY
jgi:hypothetical protein